MLVVSALFVLLALGLLIAGLVTTVGLIYLSIAASLVAAGLLAVGVQQRRPKADAGQGRTLPSAEDQPPA